jgi:hypothetical protein
MWDSSNRERRPPKQEIIFVPSPRPIKNVFASDQPQRPIVPDRTPGLHPTTYDPPGLWGRDKHESSMVFVSKSRSSLFEEPSWAGQSPRTTSRGAYAFARLNPARKPALVTPTADVAPRQARRAAAHSRDRLYEGRSRPCRHSGGAGQPRAYVAARRATTTTAARRGQRARV